MNAALLYVLIMLPGQGWHGSVVLHTTSDLTRCERMQAQVQSVARDGVRYRCETLVGDAAGVDRKYGDAL